MTFTNTARDDTALLLAFGSSASYPRYCGIGSGSGVAAVTDIALIAEVGSRADFTSRDTATAKQVEWIYDFSSIEMSGIDLKEFGIFDVAGATSGNCWARESLPSITFDGTNELQISMKFTVF